MVTNIKKELADLLRSAAQLTISETEFWDRFEALVDRTQDPIGAIADETAIHYWGNFHERNLLLMPVKPDRDQLQQGQEELNVIADGLEQGWSPSELEQKLKDI
jgi:hypothetical protein